MPRTTQKSGSSPLDDPETVERVLAGLDRTLADLRSVRETLEEQASDKESDG
jgi:hypothetical protein